MANTFDAAFNAFMNQGFEEACVSSTEASWGGSSYSVELFPDRHYTVHPTDRIGNQYDSPGIILQVATLGEDDWCDDGDHFFDNAEEEMRDDYVQVKEDRLAYAQ